MPVLVSKADQIGKRGVVLTRMLTEEERNDKATRTKQSRQGSSCTQLKFGAAAYVDALNAAPANADAAAEADEAACPAAKPKAAAKKDKGAKHLLS